MSQLDFAFWNPIKYGFNSGLMQTPIRELVAHITDGHGRLQSVHRRFQRGRKNGASAILASIKAFDTTVHRH